MGFRYAITLIIITTFFLGCKRNEPKRMTRKDVNEAKKTFVKINKVLIDEDRTLIEGYVKRHRLDGIKESGSGLYSLVWGEATGDSIKVGDVVEFSYRLTLLDGTLCYQSSTDSPKKFKVGMGGVESGLEQAVLLMKKGQKGKFILPPHLAHGLIGDADKIPARAIIVYDIEMLNVYR